MRIHVDDQRKASEAEVSDWDEALGVDLELEVTVAPELSYKVESVVDHEVDWVSYN